MYNTQLYSELCRVATWYCGPAVPEAAARTSVAPCFGHGPCGESWTQSCDSRPSPGCGLYGDWSSHGHGRHDDFESDDCRDVNNILIIACNCAEVTCLS